MKEGRIKPVVNSTSTKERIIIVKRIDALIIGLCIIVAAIVMRITPRVPADRVGRYQIAGTGGVNVFVLDTRTGKIWSKYFNPTSGATDWDLNTGPWIEK